MKTLKSEEELGRDRNLEFETDDEENQAQSRYSSPTSSSSAQSIGDDGGDGGSYYHGGGPSSYQQPTWPQSYRPSIDMLTNVVSPSVGFITGSSILEVGSSFLRPSRHSSVSDRPTPLTKPLIIPYYNSSLRDSPQAAPPPPQPHYTVSFQASSIPSFAKSLPPTQQYCSTSQAIINGLNVLCGVGLLTTPYAAKQGGWLGLLLLFLFGSISFYTGVLLKRCLDSAPGLQTYPDIGQAAFGKSGRVCISIALYLELYACCVEYITLVGDSVTSMFPDLHLNLFGASMSSHQIFALAAALAVLPTVWLRDLSLLSYLSAGGVIVSILVVLCLFWDGVVDGVGFHRGGTMLDLANLPVALGMYGFCYSGHSVFPNIYSSMKNRAQFPTVLLVCFVVCTVIYAGVATAGFLMFGESIKSQFTLNMPRQYMSSKIAVWTTVLNPLSKYALTMTPVALSIEELLPVSRQSHSTVVLIRTLLVFSTLVVALAVPFFGLVMALLGSIFAMFVALIMPCACYLSIHRNSVNILQATMCILVMTLGVVCSCIGSFSSIKNIVNGF